MARRNPRSETNDMATRVARQTEAPPPAGAASVGRPERDRASRSMGSEPSEDDIRLRAYQRYLERGGGHGMDFDDWLEAEQELKGKTGN